MFDELKAGFPAFLDREGTELKSEYLLPSEVGRLVQTQKACVKVIPTNEKWFGVTYQEDKPIVQEAIRSLINNGVYPEQLWG